MKLTLDENHIYRDESGIIWPSVSEILRVAGLGSNWGSEEDRLRGQYVHEATAFCDMDQLDEDALDPTIRPYVSAWLKFQRESGFEVGLIEEIVWNERLHYAGRLDRGGKLNGRRCVLDIKSGAIEDWTALQLAAYAMTGKDGFPLRVGVELRADGTYTTKEFQNVNDYRIWEALTLTYHWKEEHKCLPK